MKFNKILQIKDKEITSTSPTFVIAEAGVNHGGDISIAKKLIDLASEASADAVKFQTFRAEQLILDSVKKAPYQQKTTEATESQMDMLKKLEVTREQNLELKSYCEDKNMSKFLDNVAVQSRSQDLEKYYRLNGAIYICDVQKFLEEGCVFLKENIFAFEMAQEKSIDIDTDFDVNMVKRIIESNKFKL